MNLISFLSLFAFFPTILGDDMFGYYDRAEPATDKKDLLNLTTGGPYTYSQSGHHFYGAAYDGSYIDTYSCCAGQSGSCRNNPSCQCQKSVGPLPQGTYTLGNIYIFKSCINSYDLYSDSFNNMCSRLGYLIKSGATLKVVA